MRKYHAFLLDGMESYVSADAFKCQVILLSVMLILVPRVGWALDLTWVPHALSTMRLEDNVRTSPTNAEAALGFDTGAWINLKAADDQLLAELIPRFNVRRFAIGKHLDADEYSFTSNNSWKEERADLGLNVSYARDSTLVSEATDSGRVDDVKDRDTLAIQPTIRYLLNEKTSWDTTFSYSDVIYRKAENSGLSDYRYLQGTTGITYGIRDNVDLFSLLSVSDFSVPEIRATVGTFPLPNTENTTTSYSAKIGATWHWDESFQVTSAIGWIQSEINYTSLECPPGLARCSFSLFRASAPQTASSGGPIATTTILKKFENITTRLDYSREVSPTGRGSQSSSDRILFDAARRVSNRTTMLFSGIYEARTAQTDLAGGGLASQDLNRDYYEAKAGFRYYLTTEWILSAFYRFGYSQSTDSLTSAHALRDSLYLTVEFEGAPNKFLDRF